MKQSSSGSILLLVALALLLLAGCQSPQPTSLAPTAPRETAAPLSPAAVATETATPDRPASPQGAPPLPFDVFVEDAFRELLRNDPEWATAEGLAEWAGADESRLTDLSPEGIRRAHELHKSLLAQLRAYPRQSLDRQQRLTYDVFEWYLDDLVRGQEFIDYPYPINQLPVLGVQYQTEYLFTDQQVIADEQDARNYLARLGQVGEKLGYVLESLERREVQGMITPRRVIEASLGDIQLTANSTPKQTSYYTAFRDHMAPLSSISPEMQRELLLAAEQEIQATVLPAYQRLAKFLEAQRKRAPLEEGVWQYPGGEVYYRYALRHHTTTDLTPDEVHQLGLDELARLQAEMRQRFDQLGYPKEASINNLYIRVYNEGGAVPANMVLRIYQDLVAQAEGRLDEAFDLHPDAQLEVRGIPAGIAYYAAAPLDGSGAGVFYVPVGENQPRYQLPTLAYHETLPGHHFQIALARQQNLPLLRHALIFGAFTEGWGMYAERLAAELGWYADDPYADLGRLQSEALRAARLVVDTGLHARRWTFDQAVDFLVENTGLPYQQMAYEVTRYIAWPGQATCYEVGLLKLLELRQAAQERLGQGFDLKDFHRAVLQLGSLPLEVLERSLEENLDAK